MLPPVQMCAVLDALVAQLSAALDVPVIDGPPDTEAVLSVAVIVGYDGASEDGRVGGFTQSYAHLGVGGQRTETGDVVCALWAQSGDADFATLRARLAAILADVQQVLRSDPTLGLDWVQAVELGGGQLFFGDADGNAARLTFSLTYTSRV